ncbi:MAG TPA: Ig-like domain-containing protein [Solirubrobacteraceae bacterium]|nr:Ig-like domain-containing protein [Solirubrobacteraceae bacterium]
MERLRLVMAAVAVAALSLTPSAAAAGAPTGSPPVFTSSDAGAVVGGAPYLPQASTTSGQAATFAIDPVATTNGACVLSAGAVSFAHAGACAIDAQDPADPGAGTAQQILTVAAASTTTALVLGPTALSATVLASAPGGGTPTGTVVFTVAGRTLGSAPLVNGVATLAYAVPPNVTEQILATYPGDADYQSSSAALLASGPDIRSPFRVRPVIVARLTSSRPRNRRGWWHTPVTVRFICHAGGSPLVRGCPHPVVLRRSGRDLRLTRTIRALDGARATIRLRGIRIDLTAPHVALAGVRRGAHYSGAAPSPRCDARDRISGIRTCRVSIRVRRHGSLEAITYVATAITRAGRLGRVRETVYACR